MIYIPEKDQGVANYGYHVHKPHQRLVSKRTIQQKLGSRFPTIGEKKKDTILCDPLFKCFPNWTWGNQGTGDCVSWMTKHLSDLRLAILWDAGLIKKPPHWARQESIYGFGRVEIYGKVNRGRPGMYGGGAAKALKRFGYLHAIAYAEADLRRYSGRRAIDWGRNGVPDNLEKYAQDYRIHDYAKVSDPTTAGLLIQRGIPVMYCGYTYWGHSRSSNGTATRFSSGWHAMAATGVRWNRNGTVHSLWIANTGHGNHCSGPVGDLPIPAKYAACGSWVPLRKLTHVFDGGDCYAIETFPGWELDAFNYSSFLGA